MNKKIALAGNPNSGKTTLFNQLTGSTAKVGNWSGVTVDRREGVYRKGEQQFDIIDLPGIYSLAPYSPEEVIARNYLTKENVDIVINIVDSTNLERNLYLTTQLLELDYPIIVALNMVDLMEKQGKKVNVKKLAKALGVPVIPIVAQNGEGIATLMEAVSQLESKRLGSSLLFEHPELSEVAQEINLFLREDGVPHSAYHTVKLLEDDLDTLDWEHFKHYQKVQRLKMTLQDQDLEAVIADARYRYIESRYIGASDVIAGSPKLSTTEKIDRIVTNRVLGIPIFLFIMFLVFHLTFSENLLGFTGLPSPGVWGQGLMEDLAGRFAEWITSLLTHAGASPWIHGLVVDGVIAGVGAVLTFLPLIFILYICLSLLEYSGYMSRAAFLLDRVFRKFGLSGKSFMPLLMGFGCSIPAIMGARTLNSERDRKLTIMLIPFMSCGAKAPIWALMAATFFPNHATLAVFSIYLLGIVVAIVTGILLKNTVFKGTVEPFIMELPTYHIPSAKIVFKTAWTKVKGFATRAGTVLTAATIVIWFLSSLNFKMQIVDPNSADSMIGVIGNSIKFIFEPLGFASGSQGWKAVVAIITGLIAKEIVISTMGILYNPGVGGDALEDETAGTALAATLVGVFSPLAAFSFMAFNLLYAPCLAAISAYHKELGSSLKWTSFTLVFHFSVAWIVSFGIFSIGSLLGF